MRLGRLVAAGFAVGATLGFAWALLRPRAPSPTPTTDVTQPASPEVRP